MSIPKQCGSAGPAGLECTRLGGEHDAHVTYTSTDDGTQRVEWYGVNPNGEPRE